MQTFIMDAEMSLRVVVPATLLQSMREQARAEGASPFLLSAQEQHPEDDDEFILMILRNGLKRHIRGSILDLLAGSGIGGSFSPLQLKDRTPPKDVPAVLATDVARCIPD